jgi:metaxin
MEAWVWGSDWGLASIDSHCLQLMAYAKFSGAPLVIHESGNPFWTPKGNLPVFRQNGVDLANFSPVVSHLRQHNYSADYNLTPKQQAEVIAFIQLMEERLYPALLQVFWLDAKNHIELTRPWFCKHMPFPLGLYYPVSRFFHFPPNNF